MKRFSLIVFLCVCAGCISAQVTFSGLDLDTGSRLLFSASHKAVTEDSYSTLFMYDLEKDAVQSVTPSVQSNPEMLTCFPQQIEVLSEGKKLQLRSRYGTSLYLMDEKKLRRTSLPRDLVQNPAKSIPSKYVPLIPYSVSSDGKWMCYIRQTSAATGELCLEEADTGRKTILSSSSAFSYDSVPVLWSPDSSILIYEKNSHLYFLNMRQQSSSTHLPEEFRQIGEGTIRNVYWASSRLLMYISREIVYAVPANELYTRALYSDLVGTGLIAGRLPYAFNESVDSFWTNSTGTSIVIIQDGRTLWYMEMSGVDFNFVTTLFSYPFVNIPGTAMKFSVMWASAESGHEMPVVWLELLRTGKTESYVYRLASNAGKNNMYFNPQPLPPEVSSPIISPDQKSVMFRAVSAVHVYDISTWKQTHSFTGEKNVSYAWSGSSHVILGGTETVRRWNLSDDSTDVLFLSSAQQYAWDGASGTVIAGNNAGYFVYDSDNRVWKTSPLLITRKNQIQNSRWRVFLESSRHPDYANSIFARNLTPMSSNIPLLRETVEKSAGQKPSVSLVFDAVENADGLTPILAALARYNLKSTFFINGEFMRRFPTAVQEIAAAGHECASMFYTPLPLDSTTYKVDETFIRRGLARNEDDFFAVTGGELSLVWHTPGYFTNNLVKTAGERAGYAYAERTIVPGDTVTLEDAAENGVMYKTAAAVIDEIESQLCPNAVIPVSTGLHRGTRTDYLYDKIDLLITVIYEAGYSIVPVTALLEN